ncbi:uncharacterized protein LOC127519844 [Ctenopharyngodon idella]|uniref:uncharacterized protein LOC127519844 n=1 Tax=Ctenopharyngodon idella TaxID=7959 RepID=UPI002232A0B8|nr:uncharacterized protein LOC127519844 [Ctenopharyngodon idella]
MSSHLCALILFVLSDVFGVKTDEVKLVSMREGQYVTLNTDVTEVQRDDQIVWFFGPQETRIAEIYNQNIDINKSDELFGHRLQMDSQTGSLTIMDIRTAHTGLYKLQIISIRGTSYKRFNVIVYSFFSTLVITRDFSDCSSLRSSVSRCFVLCSVFNVSHVTLSWYKGNSLLSSISVSDLSFSLSLPLEVEYQDKNTYSCVLNNPIRNQTKHLTSKELCHTFAKITRSSFNVIAIITVVCVQKLLISACVFYCGCRKYSQEKTEDQKSMSEYTEIIYRLQI